MSAEEQGNAVSDNGPTIITVVGQDPIEPLQIEAKKPEEVKVPAGSEESNEEVVDETKEGRQAKPGVQTRIDELTRARREAEREAEYWKNRAQGTGAAAAKEAEKGPPTRDKYETDEAYMDALTDYKVDQKLAARDQQKAQQATLTERATTWQEKLETAKTEIPDFAAVMEAADTPCAPHVAELIMEADNGAKILHHLAQNPEQVEKMNGMSPAKVAMELGKLSVKFDTPPAAASSEPAGKTVSKAPPPASRTVGAGRAMDTPLGELPMEDYIATRKAQGASWAR